MKYIIVKRVEARSLKEALKKELLMEPESIKIDKEAEKLSQRDLNPAIGFDFSGNGENEDDE